jgi:hypothetical protein
MSKTNSRRKILAAIAFVAVCGSAAAGILMSSNSSKGNGSSTNGPATTPPTSGPNEGDASSLPTPAPTNGAATTPPTTAPTGIGAASLTARFMSRSSGDTRMIGGNAGRRLSAAIPPRSKSRHLADATNGGSASESDVEVFKLSLRAIVLCSQVPVGEMGYQGDSVSSFDKMKRADVGQYGCVNVYGSGTVEHAHNYWTEAVDCTYVGDVADFERKYECADTGAAFDRYVASLPEEDWVDLADPEFMKNFAIQAAPAAGSNFTWGWVQWRDAGIMQATIPLDGGGNVYTKSAARSDRNNEQRIGYFPSVISAADADMLEGPAEPMKYMIDHDDRRSVFQLGEEMVLESEKLYKLDLTYSLDRSVITAVTEQDIFRIENFGCKRAENKTRLYGCGTTNINIISLRDEGEA